MVPMVAASLPHARRAPHPVQPRVDFHKHGDRRAALEPEPADRFRDLHGVQAHRDRPAFAERA